MLLQYGMTDIEPSTLIYKLILLAGIVSAYLALRGNPKKEFKFALVWVVIITVLMLGYSMLNWQGGGAVLLLW